MKLYLLTTILLVLMDPGIMKIEARFDVSSRTVTVMTKDSSGDDTCIKQSVLLTHEDLSETCGTLHSEKPFETRIINGYEAEPGQFPFAVKIIDTMNGSYQCGGSIIDSKYILTAAHCITTDNGTIMGANELAIEVGAHFFNLSSKDCRVEHEVKKLNIHPLYYSLDNYDIGIIELKEPINFEYYHGGYGSRGPICLSHGDDNLVRVGQNLSVAGWGSTSIFGHKPEMLNFDTYQVSDRSECPHSSDNEICTREDVLYKSTYYGDSGSALFAKIDNKSFMQVGIVSRTDRCRGVHLDIPKSICLNSINTRVYFHLEWIETIIGHKPMHQ